MCSSRVGRFGRRAVFLALLAFAARPAQGQDLEESRRRLEEVRKEREQLQQERERLQGQVHDLGQELDNLEKQRQSTNRIVNELETQIGGLNTHVDQVSAELALAQDNLAEKRAVLARRMVEIYKRGDLYPFQVLVAAESFGDLLNRYKYLYLTSRQDQALVTDVEKLRDQVLKRRGEMVQIRTELDRRREEREAELRTYGSLVQERTSRLSAAKRSAQSTEQRLSALDRDEARLNDVLETLERARRNAEARGGRPDVASAGTLTTADIGKLDWPVDGTIIYSFGRQTLPSGGVIRRNGIGIAAPAGTPIKAVETGKVELVQSLGTYGLTVVLTHGNGYRSLYMHLDEAKVTLGQDITKGQIIGTVGGTNTDEGAHLYFEIRGENGIALDPADWLKRRR
jgi:septal ring factor EnvC (AmiA/AmiB activator)